MKKLLIILLSIGLFSACKEAKKEAKDVQFPIEITLKGTTTTPEENNTISIMIPESGEEIANFEVGKDGKFSQKITVPSPNLYRVNVFNQKGAIIILDHENATISYQPEQDYYTVGGSDQNKILAEYLDIYYEKQQERNELEEEMQTNQDEMAVRQKIDAYLNKAQTDLMAFARKYPSSLTNLIILEQIGMGENVELADSIQTALADAYPNHSGIQELGKHIEGLKATAIGSTVPDITLPNPDGKELKLSDLRGKVVMIDFWASWCQPCRLENPNVVEAYKQYNDKGFEVFSVSLDQNEDKWKEAIKEDNLLWNNHVIDLENIAGSAYNVMTIPSTFLIDAEGKIIAKNLRGPALEEKLAEVLGE
ncbi:TlpA disulfide reductase family protein [Algivirga pacifica]|uniref:TlpA disulfide reductase family protein n=1 Tax=Algivirga pacifica TaxID=1162670 RepID=A0ABP9DLL3_9BACT